MIAREIGLNGCGQAKGTKLNDTSYRHHDRIVWERIFADMPDDWYEAPPSDAMRQCRGYFAARRCSKLLDLGCGFGRWAHDLLTHGVVEEVVGVDYAANGIRAASAWAARTGVSVRFLVASAVDPPFRSRTFDAVLAALLLDGLSRRDCRTTVKNLAPLLRPGAYGFFVFNPVLSEADLAAHQDNPTKDCLQVAYADEELPKCLPGWTIDRLGRTSEGFRIVEAHVDG